MITWFTQPNRSFSSYYYFDENTRRFVRIRLELGRGASGGDGGETCAMYRKNRYVGFSKKNYDTAARAKFFIDDDAIKTDTDGCLSSCIPSMRAEVMQTNPQSGFIVYDFSSTDNVHPVGTPHKGNVVTTAPALPNGISENDLEELAKKCMLKKADIKLTDGDADEKALAAAIKAQIANGKVNATAQMSDSGSSS